MTTTNQGPRLGLAALITALLLLLDATVTILGATDGLAGPGLQGPGIAALLSATLAFAFADAGLAQWKAPAGADRGGLVKLGLAGLFWGFVRVNAGDAIIVLAIVGMTWVVAQAALFTAPAEDEEEDEDADATLDDEDAKATGHLPPVSP